MFNLNNPSIILFYANWCGYCKEFMPNWNRFKMLLQDKEINIYEIESSNKFINKIKNFNGFPSIYYIDNNQVIEYNDKRDYKSLINFVYNKIKN
jgi:thiol-disulfide isomerase/thioredoxin